MKKYKTKPPSGGFGDFTPPDLDIELNLPTSSFEVRPYPLGNPPAAQGESTQVALDEPLRAENSVVAPKTPPEVSALPQEEIAPYPSPHSLNSQNGLQTVAKTSDEFQQFTNGLQTDSKQLRNGLQDTHATGSKKSKKTNETRTLENKEFTNGSTTVAKQFTNGLQTELERFTHQAPHAPAAENDTTQKVFQESIDVPIEDAQNGLQTVAKRSRLLTTNGCETDSKRFTNQPDSPNHPNNGSETVYKLGDKRFTNGCETVAEQFLKTSFSALVGVEKRIVQFVFECSKVNRGEYSNEMSLDFLADAVGTTKSSIKSTLFRLREKGVIRSYFRKNGRAGWSQYSIHDEIYRQIVSYEQISDRFTNGLQTVAERSLKAVTNQVTTAPSSSSSLNSSETIKTNTSDSNASNSGELPSDWDLVDYSALHDLGIHFGKQHIRQIYSRKWCTSSKDLQDSLNHFAHFMANVNPDKSPKQPINVFMAVMRDGHYYGRPEGYLSPEERAEKTKLEAEQRKADHLRQYQQQRFEALFEQWFSSLRGTEIHALTPAVQGYDEKKKFLKFYFRDQFWLEIKDNPSVDVTALRVPVGTNLSSKISTLDKSTEDEFQTAFEDLDQRIQDVEGSAT